MREQAHHKTDQSVFEFPLFTDKNSDPLVEFESWSLDSNQVNKLIITFHDRDYHMMLEFDDGA